MRLLYFEGCHLRQTKDLAKNVPSYAILSHTWGADDEEVTFQDVASGVATTKPGYRKIEFCGNQAAADGLRYFWIDTCCIDKTNSVELSEAINSMFRWYQNASRCYVYLSDLSVESLELPSPWESVLAGNRWFTRGWTLQELVAPASVEFFSKEGRRLGDKTSLECLLSDITGIPAVVLQGYSLADCSVQERFKWAERRNTTREEDKAYSLLGIFDVQLPLIYGEGLTNAQRRLHEEIFKVSKGTYHEDFSVPFSLAYVPEVEHFVAREQELTVIHQVLRSNGSRRIAVLHGLGGIGKTQLAVAYAKRHKNDFSAIFWLNIKDIASLQESFRRAASLIRKAHPSAHALTGLQDTASLNEVVAAIKAWLSLPRNTRWLLIYDNHDNPKLPGMGDSTAIEINDYLPESYQGAVIITTRIAHLQIGHSISVRKMERTSDLLEMLSNFSGRKELSNDHDAVELIKHLDGLPLAIATAGAYLRQTTMTFARYLHLYKQSWAKLQQSSPELRAYDDRTLYSTWQISLDQVRQVSPSAAELLRLWAYLDNDDVWFELLHHADEASPDWFRTLTEDEISFSNAMRVLCNYGLVESRTDVPEAEAQGYSIHACVYSWATHVLNTERESSLVNLSLKLVGSHIPSNDSPLWWVYHRRLMGHALRCADWVAKYIDEDGLGWVFHSLGDLLAGQTILNQAEQMYERALRGKEKALGPDHTSTLNTVNNLGNLYTDQGRLDAAEKMYERAFRGKEKALGPDHTSTLDTVNNLGNLYKDQGRLDAAEKMYERALGGYEKALGPDHTSTLDTVNNLGLLYTYQARLDAAEKMYERALRGYEKAIGTKNLGCYRPALNSIWGLGQLLVDADRPGDARPLLTEAEAGFHTLLGPSSRQVQQLRRLISSLDAPDDYGLPESKARRREKSSKPHHFKLIRAVARRIFKP